MKSKIQTLLALFFVTTAAAMAPAADAPEGWTTAAPREEIKPDFAFDPQGGPDHRGCFIIESGSREGLVGRWTKTFPVHGVPSARIGGSVG
jgi:hypothetical protein